MNFSLELTSTDFQDVGVCLGRQLKIIINTVDGACSGLTWYCGDVQPAPISSGLNALPTLRQIASANVAGEMESVLQFLRGVFVAFESSARVPREIEVDSENLEPLSTVHSFVEIHCFDTTLFWIATDREPVFHALKKQFNK